MRTLPKQFLALLLLAWGSDALAVDYANGRIPGIDDDSGIGLLLVLLTCSAIHAAVKGTAEEKTQFRWLLAGGAVVTLLFEQPWWMFFFLTPLTGMAYGVANAVFDFHPPATPRGKSSAAAVPVTPAPPPPATARPPAPGLPSPPRAVTAAPRTTPPPAPAPAPKRSVPEKYMPPPIVRTAPLRPASGAAARPARSLVDAPTSRPKLRPAPPRSAEAPLSQPQLSPGEVSAREAYWGRLGGELLAEQGGCKSCRHAFRLAKVGPQLLCGLCGAPFHCD